MDTAAPSAAPSPWVLGSRLRTPPETRSLICDDTLVGVGGELPLALFQVGLQHPHTRPLGLRAACTVHATAACAAGQQEPARPRPLLEKCDYLFLQGA